MRIGLMIGPERGRYRTKVQRMQADARWAEESGLASVWIPPDPRRVRRLTAAALVGVATDRIEVGTAVVPGPAPAPHRAGPAGPVGPGRLRGAPGRSASACPTTG